METPATRGVGSPSPSSRAPTTPDSDSYTGGATGLAVGYVGQSGLDIQASFLLNYTNATAPSTPRHVTISPDPPPGGTTLTASASGSRDPDGYLYYIYRWYKSTDAGATWQTGPRGQTLSGLLTHRGEQWKAAAQSYDGDHLSARRFSAPVTLVNARPRAPRSVTISPNSARRP